MLPRNWGTYQNAECLSTRKTLRRKHIVSIYLCQLAYLLHLGTTGTRVCLSSWRRNNVDKLEVHVTTEWNEIQITALNLSVTVAVTWLSRWSSSASDEDCAQSPSSPSDICSRQRGIRRYFSPRIPVFPRQYHSISAPRISTIYHQHLS